MFGLGIMADIAIGLAKSVTALTENEIDDKVVEIIEFVTDGDYSKAIKVLAELVDTQEVDKVKDQ